MEKLKKILDKIKIFLKNKNIEITFKRYGIDALGAMAQGLFASLLIGTIIETIGSQFGIEILTTIGGYAKATSGVAMAVAIGYALEAPPLVLFSLTAVGSAAICAALSLTGLAGGAAVAGCCAHMIGFAVISFKENGWGGLFAQGIGTSMLQMGNIMKNPRIALPPIIASAITGPIATCIFKMQMNGPAISSGMGTCGMVGPIGVYSGWISDIAQGSKNAISAGDWIGLFLICIVLPAIISLIVAKIFRKKQWIKEDDLKLSL